MLEIVILAAGKGTRMRSNKPKVMHTLAGKPFLHHVVERAHELSSAATHVVVGHGAEEVKASFEEGTANFVVQAEQLGTGHAVQQALPHIQHDSTVLILYGDVPLIQRETLARLAELVTDSSLGLLTISLENPHGYGRIVRNDRREVVAIVEQKDATEDQLNIQEVNTGVMAVKGEHLHRWLPLLQSNNAQGEYYLTDIIALAAQDGVVVQATQAGEEWEVMGVNDRSQQAALERVYQRNLADRLLKEGLTLLDPARFDCRGELRIGQDCYVDVNCVFEGNVVLGNNVSIGPNCVIKNAVIGDNTTVLANCIIEDSEVLPECNIGPYARLRPGTKLDKAAKIGNFVETKNAYIGQGSKVNHLSYVGDATLGQNVNVGAGTITCNYDGANKHKTEIADDVFVGSNSALVAPVKIGEGVTIAAGSVVTKDVTEGVLVIARAKQAAIPGWSRPVKKKK